MDIKWDFFFAEGDIKWDRLMKCGEKKNKGMENGIGNASTVGGS